MEKLHVWISSVNLNFKVANFFPLTSRDRQHKMDWCLFYNLIRPSIIQHVRANILNITVCILKISDEQKYRLIMTAESFRKWKLIHRGKYYEIEINCYAQRDECHSTWLIRGIYSDSTWGQYFIIVLMKLAVVSTSFAFCTRMFLISP